MRIPIGEDDSGERLDAVVARQVGVSRNRASELVAAGAVTVDGRVEPKSYRVRPPEVVDVAEVAEPEPAAPPPPPPTVWEDEHVLVIDKPPGLVVHPASGVKSPTLVDSLVAAGVPLAPRGGESRPGIVHRLDRDVSGLLMIAKTDEAHEELQRALKAREVRREYLAAVLGVPSVELGTVDAPVGRHPRRRYRMAVVPDGKHAVTHFHLRERLGADASLLEIRLETGRTHQIRVHLASIGHPVLGDTAYGQERVERPGLDRPFLHAWRLLFDHPVSGDPLELRCELPAELREAAERLRD